ncbi:MAG: glycosyltransferase [Prevotella sp.]|jgi:glycosyltransferase involved in cell wall biosynthesis|nr:glycosyltransferase family 2 protein [Prevotella sp.]MCH4183428.1 glycosyltransferase [Prevotella sp.]
MEDQRISIITVCFNAANDLRKTIESVKNQTCKSLEYIVIDGGSRDDTLNIIKGSNDVINFWISEPDNGIYDAMNKGIKKATGEWLIFMNAGDVFVTDKVLEEFSEKLSDNIDILRGNIVRIYDKFKAVSQGITSQNPTLMDMISGSFHHQACLIRRKLFLNYGLYSTEYKLCSDWKFFFDCVVLHHVKTRYVNYTVAAFRMDGASSNNTQRYENESKAYLVSLYGDEIVGCLTELIFYRRYKVFRLLYSTYKKIKDGLSPRTYSKILNAKRIINSALGRKVH